MFLGSAPGFPHISQREMYHARPALLTVFSTTQLGHSITQLVFIRSRIWQSSSKHLDLRREICYSVILIKIFLKNFNGVAGHI